MLKVLLQNTPAYTILACLLVCVGVGRWKTCWYAPPANRPQSSRACLHSARSFQCSRPRRPCAPRWRLTAVFVDTRHGIILSTIKCQTVKMLTVRCYLVVHALHLCHHAPRAAACAARAHCQVNTPLPNCFWHEFAVDRPSTSGSAEPGFENR